MGQKQGSGIGLVILVIVMAVVLLLVTKAWKSMSPSAMQAIDSAVASPRSTSDKDNKKENAGSLNLPDLEEMGENTDEHTEEVEEALDLIE